MIIPTFSVMTFYTVLNNDVLYSAKYRNNHCISTESLVPFLFTPPLPSNPIYH